MQKGGGEQDEGHSGVMGVVTQMTGTRAGREEEARTVQGCAVCAGSWNGSGRVLSQLEVYFASERAEARTNSYAA